MPKISVVIITKNEAKNIERCLASCAKVSDDIVVIDAFSTDNTVSIAMQHSAKVTQLPWEGYGQNKNKGNVLTKYDWVLSIDADEELNENLIKELQNISLENNVVYSINRLTRLGSQWVKHSGWHPLYLPRLFQKSKVQWNNEAVHEALIIPKGFKTKRLGGLLLHYSFDSIKDFEMRLDNYSNLRAQKWINNQNPPSLFKRAFGPIGRFLTVFIFKGGFLDGGLGYYIAKQEALMVAKALKLYSRKILQ
jgi:glycosyltransferase involved in cell wall biosynthesis